MKRVFIAIAACLVLAFAVSHVDAYRAPPLFFHDPSNPWCSHLVSVPTAPECPSGMHMDPDCLAGANAWYRDQVGCLYNTACADYDTAADACNGCRAQASSDYANCLLSAGNNQAAINACKAAYQQAKTDCAHTFTASVSQIADDVNSGEGDAFGLWFNAVLQCCIGDG